jgi:hypothetical protein
VGSFGGGKTRAQAAVGAEDVDVVLEGDPPADNPAVESFAILLDQREHLRCFLCDKVANLLANSSSLHRGSSTTIAKPSLLSGIAMVTLLCS